MAYPRPGEFVNPRLQFVDPLHRRVKTRHQRQDQGVLFGVRQVAEIRAGHALDLESTRP